MHFLGLAGMPRRIPDYALQYTEFNQLATVGALILGAAQLIFLYNIIMTIRGGKKASEKVWEGSHGSNGQYHPLHLIIRFKQHPLLHNKLSLLNELIRMFMFKAR